MNTKLSVVGSKVINTVCFMFVNFDSALIVLKAETAFSVLFNSNLDLGLVKFPSMMAP